MNAGRHINFEPVERGTAVNVHTFTQLLKIAEILAHPMRLVHSDHLEAVTEALQQEQLEGLCRSNEIGKRLNAAVSDQLGASALELDPATLTSDVCGLVIAPYSAIEAFLRQVTAVRLQHAIRNCVLKADRERVRHILGDDAYNTALREAPFFYADMADASAPAFFANNSDATVSALSVGATITHRYVQTIDAGLAQIFAWRLPTAFIANDEHFDAAQQVSFARLLRSKGPQTTTGRA